MRSKTQSKQKANSLEIRVIDSCAGLTYGALVTYFASMPIALLSGAILLGLWFYFSEVRK